MKILLTGFFFSFFPALYAQPNACESILWSNVSKLTWKDFKGNANESVGFAALSTTGINYSWTFKDDSLVIESKTNFSPCLSWTKFKSSEILLAHEQSHFDITEYYRRQFLNALIANPPDPANIDKAMNKLYQQTCDQIDAFQNHYDKATDFSRDKDSQKVWTQKINNLLKDQEFYSNEFFLILQ